MRKGRQEEGMRDVRKGRQGGGKEGCEEGKARRREGGM